MKANLYLQVFGNTDKGVELIKRLQRDFPETTQGQSAYQMLEAIQKEVAAKQIQSTLVAGAPFPDFKEKDVAGKPLSLAQYKGKGMLLSFWATASPACLRKLPELLKTYEKHQAKGLEIIGISLDDDPEKLTRFIKEKSLPWPQYCDGQGWQNKLAVKYGIYRLPTTYLLDGGGKIIGKDLSGDDLELAVAKALAKN
jgi:peroxiredoxin